MNIDQSSHSYPSLENFITVLKNSPRSSYSDLMQALVLPAEEVQVFATWSKECYTRNCIFETEQFELILLCWEAGQETPIHGHNGEACWVKILAGMFEEKVYIYNDDRKLLESKTIHSVRNDLSYMEDFMGFHKLKNHGKTRGMTLHLYAKPIRECKMYKESELQFVTKQLNYDTKSNLLRHLK